MIFLFKEIPRFSRDHHQIIFEFLLILSNTLFQARVGPQKGFPDLCILDLIKYPFALTGVLAPRLRTIDVSARPHIDKSVNFLAHVSAESPLNISPNLSEVITEVLETYKNFTKYPPCPPKYVIVW
jgi:hypothetical protein